MYSEQKLEPIIRKLWQLKKQFDKKRKANSQVINFDRLLRNPVYREKVLLALSGLPDEALSLAAGELLAMKLEGSVHIDDIKKHQKSTGLQHDAFAKLKLQLENLQHSTQILQQRIKRYRLGASLLAVCLLLSIIGHGYPFIKQTLMQKVVYISGPIRHDSVWQAGKRYVLQGDVFVENQAVLSIEAGSQIFGEKDSSLIITRGAKLLAKGKQDAPIVFTSSQPTLERRRGDWGGLVLMGDAPVNREGQLEGIDKNDPRGRFGGNNPLANCGVLEYVRVEYAGFETFVDNELNGLTLAGCGRETVVRYVQVHKALDDGIEVFGGTVDLRHIVVTGAGDDGFDWDMGWQGRVQFLVVQMHGDAGDNAFEGDSDAGNADNKLRSQPTFYNVTLVGANTRQISQRAMTIRRGSGGRFVNVLMMGFSKSSIDLRGDVKALLDAGYLSFEGLFFYDVADGKYFEREQGSDDDDNGFDEGRFFTQQVQLSGFSLDPRMPASSYSQHEPRFTPMAHSPLRHGSANIPQGEFWDEGANYIGAIRPGAASAWLDGWVTYE